MKNALSNEDKAVWQGKTPFDEQFKEKSENTFL